MTGRTAALLAVAAVLLAVGFVVTPIAGGPGRPGYHGRVNVGEDG